jgi:hypothetical protein
MPIARRSWREEIRPSLSAWAALAAVWVVLIAVEWFDSPPAPTQARKPAVTLEFPPADSLLAFHNALNSATSQNLFP